MLYKWSGNTSVLFLFCRWQCSERTWQRSRGGSLPIQEGRSGMLMSANEVSATPEALCPESSEPEKKGEQAWGGSDRRCPRAA